MRVIRIQVGFGGGSNGWVIRFQALGDGQGWNEVPRGGRVPKKLLQCCRLVGTPDFLRHPYDSFYEMVKAKRHEKPPAYIT